VNPAEVVERKVQAEGGPEVFPLFGEGVCQPRQPPDHHPHGEVLALHVARQIVANWLTKTEGKTALAAWLRSEASKSDEDTIHRQAMGGAAD